MVVVLATFDFCCWTQSLTGLWAYIDPGVGSLIFQVVAASLISAGLFITGVRDRIVWLVTGAWRSKPRPTTDAIESVGLDDRKLDLQATPLPPAAHQGEAPGKAA